MLYQLSYVGETPTVAVSGASDPRRARYFHGQTGVAPNAIELHSIIGLVCLSG